MVYTPEPTIMAEDLDDYVPDEELVARMQAVGNPALTEEQFEEAFTNSGLQINREDAIISEFRAREEELGEVVVFVQWDYYWKHPDYPGTTLSSLFQTELPAPDSENFIELDSIDAEILKTWVLEVEQNTLKKIGMSLLEQFPWHHKYQNTTVYTLV